MSEDRLALVRRYLAAFGSGGLDASAQFWHPDITWRAIPGAPDDVGVISGPDALRAYYRHWLETFDDIRTETEELIEAGEQVVAVLRAVGRMKESDAELELRYAVVLSIRDGKIAAGREYATRDDALQASAAEA